MKNIKSLKIISLSIVATLMMFGCSSSDDGGDTSAPVVQAPGSEIGYLVDSPIEGLNYTCGTHSGLTGKGGYFSCTTYPVTFLVGAYVLGSINHMTTDNKIYPQDLLGLDRNDSTNSTLIELVQFLQGLDDDGEISEAITITEERRKQFRNNEGDGGGSSGSSPSQAGENAGLSLPSPASAMDHLRKSISPQDYQHADTTDLAPYMGKWIGGGWGWEVRFKQTSGEFVSGFVGANVNELPFDNEKIIMSLTVTHKTAFSFDVDADGQVSGEGTITYNLLPNLCGLNALVSDMNSFVGFFDKIFSLGGIAGAKISMNNMRDGASYLKELSNLAGSVHSGSATFLSKDWRTLLGDYAKKAYQDTQVNNNICSAVTTNAKVPGGLSVGPLSVEELLYNGGVDYLKAMSTITDPISFLTATASLVLSVPGLTQVQYQYKGLENGPEIRKFSFNGHIDEHGKLFLNMTDILDGSDDLTVEYMVNWQTDRATFPTWSPFLDEGATIYPGERTFTTYDYVTKNVQKSYTAYDPAGIATQKTVTVPTPTLVASTLYRELPMAIFKASGTKRNKGAGYEWHEYEYEWNAYKMGN